MPRYSDALAEEIDSISNDVSSSWQTSASVPGYSSITPDYSQQQSLSQTAAPYNASSTPDVIWDSETQGYSDQMGHYSYDGGNTWGARQAPIVSQATVPGYQPAPMPDSQPLSLGQWQSQVDNPHDTYNLNNPTLNTFSNNLLNYGEENPYG